MSERVKYMVLGVVAAAILVVGTLGGIHIYHDHNQLHFNSQLLEVVRRAVIEKHPELAQPQAVEAPPSTPEG